jgi:hypothetical protein
VTSMRVFFVGSRFSSLRDGSGHRGERNGVCWRSCVTMRKYKVQRVEKAVVFFLELLTKTRSFHPQDFWASTSVKQDV